MTNSKTELNYIVPALARGLQVLELFDADHPKLSINEITDILGNTTSQVYRTLYTLTKMNYLIKAKDKKYMLGPQVLNKGFSYLASNDIVEVAAPLLTQLRDTTSATCHLGVRNRIEVIYQYRAQSKQQLVTNFPVGTRIPAHRCALGRVLLSGLETDKVTQLFQHVALDDSLPPSPRSLPELIELLAQDREHKYVHHYSHSSQAVATPIVDAQNQFIAAINLSQIELKKQGESIPDNMLQQLFLCAQTISAHFGGADYFNDVLEKFN